MLFNRAFCGDNHCFDYTPNNITNINTVVIKNGVYDELFLSKNSNLEFMEDAKHWNYETIFYALFKNDLFAGNVSFTSDTVSAIRVKRRKISEFDWQTFFEVPIETNQDFNFERFDRYVRGSVVYDYSLVPVINGIEGNLSTASITTEFDGFYFIEKDTIIRAYLNTQLSTQRNHNGKPITTLGRKYPYYITNGSANHTTGSLTATFIDLINNVYDVENGWKFREVVDDFLTNGRPKILKNDEGKMWMVAIVDNVPQDFSIHWNCPVHTINFTEIGNSEDVGDLYSNNFTDFDPREL